MTLQVGNVNVGRRNIIVHAHIFPTGLDGNTVISGLNSEIYEVMKIRRRYGPNR